MKQPFEAKIWNLPAGRRFTALFGALLALGIGASYSNSLRIGFYFDDVYGIAQNPAIRSLRNIPAFFIDPHAAWTERSQVDMRPILLISYALNYAVSGLDPWSYHLLNLLLHFAAAATVFFIVRDHLWWPAEERGASGYARLPAAAAALFFALAPLNTQPVDYVWARSILLCGAFYLGAFLSFLNRRWKSGSALFAMALLTKAVAVTLPAIQLIYGFLYRDRSRHPTAAAYLRDYKRLLVPVGLPALLSLAYAAYRAAVLPSWAASTRAEFGVTPLIWMMSEWPALLYYARLFVWPAGLSVDHDFPYAAGFFSPRVSLSLLVLLAWIAVAARGAGRRPLFAFATAWFFVTLAPESSLAPLAEVVNDHRPYVASSLGLSVMLAQLLDWAASWFGANRRAAFICAGLLLCLIAIPVTRRRNRQWQDSLRLWESAARASPNNGRAWMNAGVEYLARGRFDEARDYFEQARRLSPRYAYVYVNLCALELAQERFDAARRWAETATREKPVLASAYACLGNAMEKLGQAGPASEAFRRALALDPDSAEAREGRLRLEKAADENAPAMAEGLKALYEQNDPVRAQRLFRKVLERNPAHYGATFQLAVALDRSGRRDLARPLWEKVLAMARDYHDRHTEDAARLRLRVSR